jgi:DNA-binding NarL/FixJ family response regulator
MTTIVLADDHNLVRQGLRTLLEGELGFDIIGEASDGFGAVDLVSSLHPDVLVIDLMMPNLNGLEVVRQVGKKYPGTRSIILSMHSNESYVLQALKYGVAGYVLKESIADELVRAINEVSSGRRYLSPPLSDQAIEAYGQKSQGKEIDRYESLTTREREVLQLAVEGYSNKEIGEKLSISPRTVESHRANFMGKLGLKTQTDLIRFALKQGIIPLEG